MNNFDIRVLDKKTCDEWIIKKHYSHTSSMYLIGFGLYENGDLEGVVVYGQPTSPTLQRYSFINRDFKFYELSRLVVQTKTKNASSFLIGNSLKLLEKPSAVVSYADSEYNHCGIVYQATNWLFTGSTISHDCGYMVDGKKVHPLTLRHRGITNPKEWAKENDIEIIKPMIKHRYFYINGNKRDKKRILKSFKYDIIKDYPKCDQKRYDDGERIKGKGRLF